MSNWWADKLGGSKQVSSTPPTQLPAPVPFNMQSVQQTGRVPVEYNTETDQVTTKAQHLRKSSICPECNSGNYFSIANTMPRCYDCGYPVVQSGSGDTGIGTGPIQAANQVSTANNYNPSQIIGRIG